MTITTIIAVVAVIVLVAIAAMRARKRQRAPAVVTPEACEWAKKYYTDEFSRDIAARFITIVAEYAPVKIPELSPDTTFVGDLGLDDLEPAEIVMAMEDEFRIKISDEDAAILLSISDVIAYIIQKNGNENGA